MRNIFYLKKTTQRECLLPTVTSDSCNSGHSENYEKILKDFRVRA